MGVLVCSFALLYSIYHGVWMGTASGSVLSEGPGCRWPHQPGTSPVLESGGCGDEFMTFFKSCCGQFHGGTVSFFFFFGN